MSTTPRHQITVEENVWQLTLATAPRGPVGASTFDELTDKTTADIPTVNTPLADALALLQPKPAEGQFADGDKTKLDGIADGANITQYEEGSDIFASGTVIAGDIWKRCGVTMSGDTALELPTGSEDGEQIAFIVFNDARDRFTITKDATELIYSNASFILVEMIYVANTGWTALSFLDNPLKEKGDVMVGIGSNEKAHLPVGTDTQVIIADSTTETGLKWGPVVADTNANLTGHVTSTGNATLLGSFTVAQLNTALSDATFATVATTGLYSDLTDKATVDLPTTNTPLATALGLKANTAALSTVATTGLYADLLSVPPKMGWEAYTDLTYATGSPPLALASNTDTDLPNDGLLNPLTAYAPLSGSPLYNTTTGRIAGVLGRVMTVTMSYKAKALTGAAPLIETWPDIGEEGVSNIPLQYRNVSSFPKGVGVERSITNTITFYQLDTWVANGMKFRVRCVDSTVEIYDIVYLLFVPND